MLETDAVCILLDADGDFAITGGRTSFATGVTAAVQGARARMGLIRGEWFLDQSRGVPYFERDNVPTSEALLGQPFDIVKIKDAMREAILDTPAITKILELTVDYDNRTRIVSVTWRALTVFGETPTDTLEV